MAGLKKRKHDDQIVRAAGGVVLRAAPGGETQVLLVHRPKYDDWTIPKGKVDPGERELDAAVREVEEETGLRCHVGRELPSISYKDRSGKDKTVRYWEMTRSSGEFAPNHEVDETRWLSLPDASRQLSYDRDREVLAAVAD